MNFMAGGIFCVKSFLLRRHAAAPCRSRHFEQSREISRTESFPTEAAGSGFMPSRHFERSREISCTQKFPVDMKRSGSKPDRKPFVKSFLLG